MIDKELFEPKLWIVTPCITGLQDEINKVAPPNSVMSKEGVKASDEILDRNDVCRIVHWVAKTGAKNVDLEHSEFQHKCSKHAHMTDQEAWNDVFRLSALESQRMEALLYPEGITVGE
jgi:hypothetical protein